MFYDDDLGIEKYFFPVCLISECASATINVYLYSVHLGIRNVTAVFHFPFKVSSTSLWMLFMSFYEHDVVVAYTCTIVSLSSFAMRRTSSATLGLMRLPSLYYYYCRHRDISI